jgi:hypothetical protein
VDASRKVLSVALDAQDARPQQPEVIEFDDINTIDPMRFADLLGLFAANDKQAPPRMEADDAIEIELSAEQMDAVLEGRWVP